MLTIRIAAPADVQALTALLAQLFAQEAEFVPDTAAQTRGLAAIIGDEKIGRILIAEENNRSIAMVNLLYTVSTALGGRVAILEDMVVDRTARGRGIGNQVLKAAMDTARADGCLRVTLLTDHDNTAAHCFYNRSGFTRSGMIPFRLTLTMG